MASIISLNSQAHFEATITNVGNVLKFKIKPVGGDITESLTYFDFNIRYAPTLNITYSNIVPNTTNFPGINIQLAPERTFLGKKYQRFVHNTSTLAEKTYTENVEYDVFQVTLADPVNPLADIQLASDLSSEALFPNDYIFSVNKGNGLPITDQIPPFNYFYPTQENPGGTEYFLSLTNVALPLELIDFSGETNEESFTLSWISTNERNFEGFELQRSLEGDIFEKVVFIDGENNVGINKYSFEDKDIEFNAKYYYRLRLIDFNGDYSYSKTIFLTLSKRNGIIKVFPNPSDGIFTVISDKDEIGDISIYGSDGRLIKNFSFNSNINPYTTKLDLSNFDSGVYFIKMKTQMIKIVKTY